MLLGRYSLGLTLEHRHQLTAARAIRELGHGNAELQAQLGANIFFDNPSGLQPSCIPSKARSSS